jgi:hypothetical protein
MMTWHGRRGIGFLLGLTGGLTYENFILLNHNHSIILIIDKKIILLPFMFIQKLNFSLIVII